jgi:hypothetical protein
MNSGLFSALAIQQTTLFLVIGLIVMVSTFNVVATLVMTVQEKKRHRRAVGPRGRPAFLLARVPPARGAPGRNRRRRRHPAGMAHLPGGDRLSPALLPARCRGDLFRLFHSLPGPGDGPRGDRRLFGPGDPARLVGPGRRAARVNIADALRYE